jgi:hypothetical protein
MPSWATSEWAKAHEERQRMRGAACSRTPTVVEPAPRDDALGPPPLQEANHERITVSVCSVRKRLLDEDNLAAKFCVDSLRYLGIIPDDCPEKVHIEVSQRKCKPDETEHVLIQIL